MKRKTMKIIYYLLLISFTPLMAQQNWTWGGQVDPLQGGLVIEHYNINLRLLPESQSISGYVEVQYQLDRTDTLRLQLIDAYQVDSVVAGEEQIAFHHKQDRLDILLQGAKFSMVRIYYQGPTPIAIQPPWTGGFTWEKDEKGRSWMGLSCQGEGAKIFMPCLDHPSSEPIQGVRMTFHVPKPYFVAANGRLMSIDTTDTKYIYHWATQYPINNYCINFTMGAFQTLERPFQSVSGRTVPMQVIVMDYHTEEGKDLLDILEISTQTQEKYFGPYPFPDDKIAVVETPYLGMEHQTINAYGNQFRFTEVGETPYDWLLHHELGHEWWGNKISVNDWADYWIHEGICSYGDWLYYWEHGGPDAYFNHVIRQARAVQNVRPIVSEPYTNSDDAYHSDVYTKGAFVMHGLRFLLGDQAFFELLKVMQQHEPFTYQNRTDTRAFIDFIEGQTDKDVRPFLEMYLYTTDYYTFELAALEDNMYRIELKDPQHSVPLEIKTSDGYKTIQLYDQPVMMYSEDPIAIDPHSWYLKKVID